MRVTVIYNPTAGDEDHSDERLRALVERAGHRAFVASVKGESLARALAEPAELIVAAGGDGTVAKAATALAGRDVPLAILPLGTANNIAGSFGIAGAHEELVAGWAAASERRLDIGVARGPAGELRFVESVGLGLLARLMSLHIADHIDDVRDARAILRRLVAEATPRRWQVELDGEAVTERCFLLEAMNVCCVGPRLELAPDADAGDGFLEVVVAGEADRPRLMDYLDPGGERLPLDLPVRRGRRLVATCESGELHVDDEPCPDALGTGRTLRIEIELLPRGIGVLVPA